MDIYLAQLPGGGRGSAWGSLAGVPLWSGLPAAGAAQGGHSDLYGQHRLQWAAPGRHSPREKRPFRLFCRAGSGFSASRHFGSPPLCGSAAAYAPLPCGLPAGVRRGGPGVSAAPGAPHPAGNAAGALEGPGHLAGPVALPHRAAPYSGRMPGGAGGDTPGTGLWGGRSSLPLPYRYSRPERSPVYTVADQGGSSGSRAAAGGRPLHRATAGMGWLTGFSFFPALAGKEQVSAALFQAPSKAPQPFPAAGRRNGSGHRPG